MKKVFLGGTCNESLWRNEIITMLDIDYFNPVVDDWTEDCMVEEKRQRESCDFCLYVITPKMTGVYAIAEVVDDSNKRPEKTIFVVIKEDEDVTLGPKLGLSFTIGQLKSLNSVSKIITNNGGKVFDNLRDAAQFMNNN